MQTTTAGTLRLARTAEIPEGTGREFKVGERYIAVGLPRMAGQVVVDRVI